jgi:hypothetical protein
VSTQRLRAAAVDFTSEAAAAGVEEPLPAVAPSWEVSDITGAHSTTLFRICVTVPKIEFLHHFFPIISHTSTVNVLIWIVSLDFFKVEIILKKTWGVTKTGRLGGDGGDTDIPVRRMCK